jgi:drug/metabolite transporter (DMT)-like permease
MERILFRVRQSSSKLHSHGCCSSITPAALWFWVTPNLMGALMLIFMGAVFTLGQWLWNYALRMGEASALAPLNYIKLLMAGVVGWLAYGETPTLETVAGGLLGWEPRPTPSTAMPGRRPGCARRR